jgi:pimeloyl-ACP methyl ester carboxylesterase
VEFQTISAPGRRHVVSTTGQGPDVVLVHGFPDTPYSWRDLVPPLVGAGWRVSVPWLRGYHPDTIVPGRGYDPESTGQDVLDLLDALDAPRGVVVGHDWGALMAYASASMAPERIPAIVTLGIPHPTELPRTPQGLWAGRHFFRHKLPGAVRACRRHDFARLDKLYRRWSPSWTGPERDRTLHDAKQALSAPGTLEAALGYYRDVPLSGAPVIEHVPQVPGLIVGGTEDGGDPPAYGRTADQMPPPSRAVVVEGTGHWPHREAPDRVMPELLAFLAEVKPAAG